MGISISIQQAVMKIQQAIRDGPAFRFLDLSTTFSPTGC
jgi:hypothetical protein